ncbi:MAG TPA: hypothetical protein VL688_12205 [Verrucomicrobiae bacterium]|jgi:hypothetical protein|nr:hypothetical protein [Verrucomicrobiae bacterium]
MNTVHMRIWIGVLLPMIGFLFLAYAFYAVRQGTVRMGGRYSGGKKISRWEHPFAFWYEVIKYALIGFFGMSPLLHPGGPQAWARGMSGLMAHADVLLMVFGIAALAYAVWQVWAGVSFGRHYQPILMAETPKRFWMNVSRFFLFGLILIAFGSMGMERLIGLMHSEFHI